MANYSPEDIARNMGDSDDYGDWINIFNEFVGSIIDSRDTFTSEEWNQHLYKWGLFPSDAPPLDRLMRQSFYDFVNTEHGWRITNR